MSSPNAKIVQLSDETKTLPDGSKIIYAETKDKILLHHKPPFETQNTYIYERKSGKILINGKPGNNADKRKMVQLGTYFLEHADDDDLVTLDIQSNA